MKEIEISGCVTLPKEVTQEEFVNKFLSWVEENGWQFGGGTTELNENGEPV